MLSTEVSQVKKSLALIWPTEVSQVKKSLALIWPTEVCQVNKSLALILPTEVSQVNKSLALILPTRIVKRVPFIHRIVLSPSVIPRSCRDITAGSHRYRRHVVIPQWRTSGKRVAKDSAVHSELQCRPGVQG